MIKETSVMFVCELCQKHWSVALWQLQEEGHLHNATTIHCLYCDGNFCEDCSEKHGCEDEKDGYEKEETTIPKIGLKE